MAPPSRDQIEQMAFMAMMDGIIHTSVPCNCATCKSDKLRGGPRPQTTKRNLSDTTSKENTKPSSKPEASGTCNHNHSVPDSKSTQSTKKANLASSQSKSTANSNATPGRLDKVNALLKADTVAAVLEVFNQTSTSTDERDLAAKIQNATKDCKLYQEVKDKVVELCDDEEVDLDAVFGLLAKFRYERNMLTTAVIKGNSEREKALLCIQRVDHLMYMLQDVAKKKDSKGNDVMHKLGDIIMEIHDLAKTPSTLYDEFLDIKEEHLDLLNDHEEMHQKFVDVNSCHEKLHSSHDKLQTEHTKTLREFSEAKKKAATVGGLKNDITRLEKAVDKSHNDNVDLKKEVERLNAELAKVNALKHENAQLKKKVTTLTVPTPPVEEIASASQSQASKKKKGKKTQSEPTTTSATSPESSLELEAKLLESEKEHEAQIAKLRKAHSIVIQELDLVRANIKQLDAIVRKTEIAKDQAVEKLEVEKATSRNWKDIAKGNLSERDRLKSEVERHLTRAARLQTTVEELQQTLEGTKTELAERTEAHKHAKEELDQRSSTPVFSVASQQSLSLGGDTIRLLRKIRSETTQMARGLEDARAFGGDVYSLLDMFHHTIRHVVSEVEKDIEEILSVKGNDVPVGSHNHIPETVLPFTYNPPPRQPPQFSPRPDYSPQESPGIPLASALPPYRPMMPPPGFSEPSPNPFNHNQLQTHNNSRGLDSPSAPFSRIVEPPGLSASLGFNRATEPLANSTVRYNSMTAPSSTSLHSHSPLHSSNALPTPNVGVIGSRSTSSKINTTPSPISTPAPSISSASGLASTNGTGATAASTTTSNSTTASTTSGLGNGAVGVDWNMWARSSR